MQQNSTQVLQNNRGQGNPKGLSSLRNGWQWRYLHHSLGVLQQPANQRVTRFVKRHNLSLFW